MSLFNRFTTAVGRLIADNVAKNKKEISESINVSPSYFSGILKGAIKINAELVQTFLTKWPVNPNWMFEKSDDFYSNSLHEHDNFSEAKESEGGYNRSAPRHFLSDLPQECQSCKDKERLIAQQQETIQALQKALIHAEQHLEDIRKG